MTELDWLDAFGDNLVYMMKSSNVTQRELSYFTGLSESAISSYINKRKIPGIKAIVNIADALECTVSELIDYGDRIE